MIAEWPEACLGEHVELVAGFAFKSSDFTDDPADVPLVKGSTVQQGYIDWREAPRWPSDNADEYSRFELVPGDVVLAMDRPWVEAGLKYAWIKNDDPKSLLVQRVARLRGVNGLRTEFLRFIIGSPRFADYIRPIVTGVNVPHISGDQIRGYKFRVPPEQVQKETVRILSAYDDLIENNTRRIAILEEMAHAIYQEWFVSFRFPGHEQVEMVESELGPIPEGWEVVPFSELADVLSGGTPKTKIQEYWDGGIPFFSPKDSPESFFVLDTARQVSTLGIQNCSSDLFPPRTVFITARGTVGNVAMPAVPMAMNQSCYALRGKGGLPQEFIFFALRSVVDQLRQRAHGAVFDTIIMDTFRQLYVLRPPTGLIRMFVDVVQPLLDLSLNLLRRNNNLRETRDLLLPKLVSGQIDVGSLDEISEAAVA